MNITYVVDIKIYIKNSDFRFYDISQYHHIRKTYPQESNLIQTKSNEDKEYSEYSLHSKSTFQDSNGQLAFLITKDFMFMSFVERILTLSKAIKDKHICHSLKQRNRLLRNIQPGRQVNQDQSSTYLRQHQSHQRR